MTENEIGLFVALPTIVIGTALGWLWVHRVFTGRWPWQRRP